MHKVVLATEKPFAPDVRDGMVGAMKQAGLEVLVLEKYRSTDDLIGALQGAHGLIVRSDKVDKKIIDAAPDLGIIIRGGAGYENIDHMYAESRGVVVETTPGQNANAVAEEVVGIMFSLARNIHIADRTMKEGKFLASELAGFELEGKRVGVHGFGNVGKLVAKKAASLGLDVYVFDVMLKDAALAKEYGATLVSSPEEVYRGMNIVTLHIPQTPKTKGIVTKDLLSLMHENAMFINTARAGIVNNGDLAALLREKPQFRYASDVNEPGFLEEHGLVGIGDRILLLPKLGAQTPEANRNVGMAAAKQMILYFAEGKIINAANDPLPPDIAQYASLAQSLGKFNGAFVPVPHLIEVVCYGETLNRYRAHFGQYILKGLFEDSLGKGLIPTEALAAAKDRGIEILYREPDPRAHGQGIAVKYTNSAESHEVGGRIDGTEGQITRVGEFKTIIPIAPLDCIVVQYPEKKGMADEIGAALTMNGYNKVNGGFRPNGDGSKAMTFYQVSPNGNVQKGVAEIVSSEIFNIAGISRAVYVNMK